MQVHENIMPLINSGLENYKIIFSNNFQQHQLQFSKDFIIKYISNIKNKLKELKCGIGQFCSALYFINDDLSRLKPTFPVSNAFVLEDRFTELFEFLIRFQIERVIENLQKSSLLILQALYEEITDSTEELPERIEMPAEKASYSLIYYLLAGILHLEPMLENSRNYITSGSMIVSLIISHILNFFQILRKNLSSFSSNSTGILEYLIPGLQKLEKNGKFLIGILKFMIYFTAFGN